MNDQEIRSLRAVEDAHWYYRGKREIARRWLRSCRDFSPSDKLLDVGCGAGKFLEEWPGPAQGVDAAAEAVRLSCERRPGGATLSPLDALPFPDGSFSAVTALDVLEHLDGDRRGFEEMARVLSPGGVVVVTVPAFMFLWSDWDEALGHRRRYTRSALGAIAPARLRLKTLRYINEVAFLAALAVRGLRRCFSTGGPRLEDRVPPRPINNLLERVFVAGATTPWWRPPVGLSVLLVAVKEG